MTKRSIIDCLKHIGPVTFDQRGTKLTYCASCNTLAPFHYAPPSLPCVSCGGIVYGELVGHWTDQTKSYLRPSTWDSKGKWVLLKPTIDRIEFLFATKRHIKADRNTSRVGMPSDFFNLDFSKKAT